MRAGDLDKRVTLQSLTDGQDAIGGLTETWTAVATLWAQVRELSGTERFEAQHVHADASVEVLLRHRDGVTPKHRLLFGTRIFDIVSVVNDERFGRKRTLRLLCTEKGV